MKLTTINAGPSVERLKAAIAKLDPQPESVYAEVGPTFLEAMRLEPAGRDTSVPNHWAHGILRFREDYVPWRTDQAGNILDPYATVTTKFGAASSVNPAWATAPREIIKLFCRYPGNLADYEFVSFLRQR